MNEQKLFTLLYAGNSSCLHLPRYVIYDHYQQKFCGPCYFREGFQSEIPTRLSVKEYSGLFGAPRLDPRTEAHMFAYMGLVMPEPNESMKHFRKRRQRISRPVKSLFPFLSALWELTGYQPPLARVVIPFVQGQNEYEIAQSMDQSIYNIQDRLAKGVRVANKLLKV